MGSGAAFQHNLGFPGVDRFSRVAMKPFVDSICFQIPCKGWLAFGWAMVRRLEVLKAE